MNLEAVEAAVLADALEDAGRLLGEAEQDAEARLDAARADAGALIEAARVDGDRAAARHLARDRAASRREAREIVLAAQRRALDQLRDRARRAADALAREDDYPDLLARLRVAALAHLGPDAQVVVDPEDEPGLVASDGHGRVDLRLATLADRAVDSLGTEVAMLWT